ncbi:MAG: sugar ABC transporter permease [Firmicutes bacterium]|nr:sugar ABC transporter permease [Bacillota bacterium]
MSQAEGGVRALWKSKIKFAFLIPAVVWVLIFTIFPLIYSLRMSFFNIRIGQGDVFIGLTNFARVFTNEQARSAALVTLKIVVVAVAVELVLGLALAVLFNRVMPARGLLRTILTMPLFATPIAIGYLFFTIFYEEGGLINGLIPWKVPWLSDPGLAALSISMVDIWQWTPFCFLVFLAALQGLSDELYEAAMIEASSGWQIFRYITLPLIQPTIVIVLLLRLAEALKLFDIPFSLTGGGPGTATQVYSLFTYRTGLRFFDLGFASALSYVMLVVVMIIVSFFFRHLRQIYD